MEKRKVQLTGGSTYVISLPKGWAKEQNIKEGSELELLPKSSSLVLKPAVRKKRKEATIDSSDMDAEEVKRAVITMYIEGFDLIRVESPGGIESNQRRSLREAGQKLTGMEVVEETGKTVVFKDILDPSELSVKRTVDRMRLISHSMFKDAIDVVIDKGDSEDIIQRDDDVDRMFSTVSRLFRSSLRDETSENREIYFDYHTAARQLERIADHATKIAEVAKEIEKPPKNIQTVLIDMSEVSLNVIDNSSKALLELEGSDATQLANQALSEIDSVEKKREKLDGKIHSLDSRNAQLLGLVVDSISRTAEYGGNIAEAAIQSATPNP